MINVLDLGHKSSPQGLESPSNFDRLPQHIIRWNIINISWQRVPRVNTMNNTSNVWHCNSDFTMDIDIDTVKSNWLKSLINWLKLALNQEAIIFHRNQTFSNSAIRECDKLDVQNYYCYRKRGTWIHCNNIHCSFLGYDMVWFGGELSTYRLYSKINVILKPCSLNLLNAYIPTKLHLNLLN